MSTVFNNNPDKDANSTFVVVQFWGQLPTLYEGLMGDTPGGAQAGGDYSGASSGTANKAQTSTPNLASYDDGEARDGSSGTSQYRSMQGSYPTFSSYSPHTVSPGRQDAFNMSAMGSTLPDVAYQSYGSPQRFAAGTSPPLQYPMQSRQFGGPPNLSPQAQSVPYNMQYQSQYSGMYATNQSPAVSNLGPGINTGSQYYPGQAFVAPAPQQSGVPYFIQPNQYGPQSQMYSPGAMMSQNSSKTFMATSAANRGNDYGAGSVQAGVASGRSGSIASSSASSVVRGPPRKPRQSGHAIWIGNLPPRTDLMSLVLHVCKETEGLESLFLISKSNCAFANFKDEASCTTAQTKIHDSRFQTVRLVSRLRRSSVEAAGTTPIPTGPAALTPPLNPAVVRTPSPSKGPEDQVDAVQSSEEPLARDKFFVVKSLTVEDLELSVRNGIWATQSHNEDTLNQAYKTAENVYLIFSANKSGEYFGYAKMISPINDDPAAAIEFAPKAQTVEDPDLPKAIPTPATEFAPKGRIIDDSARGTIFWEAERDEDMADGVDGVDGTDGSIDEEDEPRSDDGSATSSKKAWGKPFQVEWISTNRLPFYRTRGLRNPWNSNREVKIARDGTELETTVGQRLIGLFHRLPSPAAPLQSVSMPMPITGTGYTPMPRYS